MREHLCMPEDGMLAPQPVTLSGEEAAALPYGALTALSLLRGAGIRAGQKVLVNGASGGIGSAAVQLAKHWGAEVTGVCSTPRLEYVRSLGADRVIDHTREDFTRSGETYDLIFDILGRSSFSSCRGSLNAGGLCLLASFKTKQVLQMLWTATRGGPRVVCALSGEKPEDLLFIKALAEAGTLRSIVDRRYPLEHAAEAHRYAESGQKRGDVVLTVAD